MAADYVLFIFFTWILCSSVIRFIGCAYVSKSIGVDGGFHFWTVAAFLNIVSMAFFLLSFGMRPVFLFCGYCSSFAAVFLMPYGLKVFSKIQSKKLFAAILSLAAVVVLALITFLPLPLIQKLAIAIYSAFIPSFILSLIYLNSKKSKYRGLSKSFLSLSLIFAMLLCAVRIVFTWNDTSVYAMGEKIFLKQWVTIALDNNFTLIYIAFILLNFARVKQELDESTEELNILEGLLPICSQCKQIRDDQGNWDRLEHYISHRSDVKFSHSICPSCIDKLYPHLKDKLREKREAEKR